MQYVGARYVPKFMGTYDPTQNYENMVIVDNGMGTSYISKVPVPANTPLTNTNYWAIYGTTNGAIINLQNQINERVKFYATVAAMSAADHSDGDIIITSGFNSAGDGGDAIYLIVNSATANGLNIIACGTKYAILLSPATTANLGKVANDNIDDVLALNIPFELSYDHEVYINGDSTVDWSNAVNIDNVNFNGHYLINTATYYRATVYITKSKDDINIKDLWFRLKDAKDININSLNIRNFNKSGGCCAIQDSSGINISNVNIQSGDYVSGIHTNGDGIFIAGGCHQITVNNGYFWCCDDPLAVVADDTGHLYDGDISDIFFNNITCDRSTNFNGVNIQNSNHKIENVYFTNCQFYSAYAPTAQIIETPSEPFAGTIDNINFIDCTFDNKALSGGSQKRMIYAKNTTNLNVVNCYFNANPSGTDEIVFVNCKTAMKNCVIDLANKTVVSNVVNAATGELLIDGLKFVNVVQTPRYINTDSLDRAHVENVELGSTLQTTYGLYFKNVTDIIVAHLRGGTSGVKPITLDACNGTIYVDDIQHNGTPLNIDIYSLSTCRFLHGVIWSSDPQTYDVGDEWSVYSGGLLKKYCSAANTIKTISAT